MTNRAIQLCREKEHIPYDNSSLEEEFRKCIINFYKKLRWSKNYSVFIYKMGKIYLKNKQF